MLDTRWSFVQLVGFTSNGVYEFNRWCWLGKPLVVQHVWILMWCIARRYADLWFSHSRQNACGNNPKSALLVYELYICSWKFRIMSLVNTLYPSCRANAAKLLFDFSIVFYWHKALKHSCLNIYEKHTKCISQIPTETTWKMKPILKMQRANRDCSLLIYHVHRSHKQ